MDYEFKFYKKYEQSYNKSGNKKSKDKLKLNIYTSKHIRVALNKVQSSKNKNKI